MIGDMLLIIVGIVGVGIASITDLRTREVPDILSYGLMMAGGAIRLITSIITQNAKYFLYAVYIFVPLLLLGNLLYRLRQWGGGDTKLLMALGILFATTPWYLQTKIPIIAIIMVNIAIFGAVYGLVYALIIGFKHKKEFFKGIKQEYVKKQFIFERIIALSIAIVIAVLTYNLIKDVKQQLMMLFLILPLLIFPYIVLLLRAVEKTCMYKRVAIKKLTPGDWVEQDVIINNKIIYKKKKLGIEEKDIYALQKTKIKDVLVKEGIPFVPPFFFGLLYTIITGKILFFF